MNVNYSSTKLKPVLGNHYGCRWRMPHDLHKVFENDRLKVEQCHVCGKKVRFKKHYKGRVDNRAYLEAKARSFAQKWGRTKRLWYKVNEPSKLIIKI